MTPGRAQTLLIVAAIALVALRASAHDVAVEQIVDVTVQPQGARLAVHLHVPATALADAKLPTAPGGGLDSAQIDGPLRVVAADAARNLDVQQNETPLVLSNAAARLGADRASVDIDLTYPIDAGSGGFSARLNTFRGAPLQPVRTIVTFLPPNGPPQMVSVIGAPTHVAFDPAALDVVAPSVGRALSVVLSVGDHLLWLVCLLLPARRARDAARLVGVTMAGQAIAFTAGVLASGSAGAAAPAMSVVAASVVVMGALQNIVDAREPWVIVLAGLFGVLSGVAFADTFTAWRQFAGFHQAIAFTAFLGIAIIGQLWLGAIVWATRAWLARLGAPDRIVTILGSALVAHTSVHRTIDRGHALAQGGSVLDQRALTWLTLGWAIAMVLVAAIELVRQRGAVGGTDGTPSRSRA